ncbi:Arc family DNA-binding protein [Morganella morganii]|uniref:Arc family DNA-binding protein n=1 Tax=Morganella morganii TaxID=582 RepID=UPI0005375354|nr:Arc family DNA-binding protein [Morganella morganii]AUT98698.1 Arc family DNA-binding protein [Morganella morganii]AVD59188.1 Arc family DNA-binding protein [Morganella morganii]MBT0428260.1 Arc family DNA-binding protein [Morganella morganii subsp. morganii]MBT0522811.1 Arc family DNA-binding protein [Morganella morganii subsp. morganii]MCW3199231.1 Arc family DNA-binding protein [Morganella morganii]
MSERKYKNPQVNLRLPVELKDRVAELAEANGRSANQEMIAAIEAWVDKNKNIQVLTLADLAERVAFLESIVSGDKE